MAPNIEINPGPIDLTVLYEQKHHISGVIWKDDIEEKLETHNSNYLPEITDSRVLDYIIRAGFYGLYTLRYFKVNSGLITALVERWRSETNTFHFPVGECTVTLQDIEILGGVCVEGKPLIRSEKGEEPLDRQKWIEELLGKRPHSKEFNAQAGISLKWLATNFNCANLPANASDELVRSFARACILRILGSQFLQDKQGSHVPLFFLPFLKDLDRCGEYSWGAAILAFLYRQLYRASVGKTKSINGCLNILQIWAWSRFKQIRPCDYPALEVMPTDGRPRNAYGRTWADSIRNYDAGGHGFSVRVYRDEFDKMQSSQIIWEPYNDVINDLPSHSKAGEAIWCARVPLVCIDIVERHYVDHVMRQFGRKQAVPGATFSDDYTLHRYSRHGNPMTNWPDKHKKYVQLWNERRDLVQEGETHEGRDTMTDDYMTWYQRITRRWIGNVMKFPPKRGIQRTGGLLELLVQGLGECYELFTRSGNQDGISTCQQLFAETGLELPRLPLQRGLRFDQRAPVVPEHPTGVEMNPARDVDVPGGEGTNSRRKRSRVGTSRRSAIRTTRSEIPTSSIIPSRPDPTSELPTSQTPFRPPVSHVPFISFRTPFMTPPGGSYNPIPHPSYGYRPYAGVTSIPPPFYPSADL